MPRRPFDPCRKPPALARQRIESRASSFRSVVAGVQAQRLRNWVDFARSSNPNSPGSLAAWPQYEGGADCYLEITAPLASRRCGLRTEKSDFWDTIVSP